MEVELGTPIVVVDHLLLNFPTLLDGIVKGVYRQQAGVDWFPIKAMKVNITVTLQLPFSTEPWLWDKAYSQAQKNTTAPRIIGPSKKEGGWLCITGFFWISKPPVASDPGWFLGWYISSLRTSS